MHLFTTRKANIQDAGIIARLATELGYTTSEKQCHTRLKALLQIPEQRIIVACDALNIVVGWIQVFLSYHIESDPYAEIGGLIVTKEYRNNGLGSMLLKDVEDWVDRSGVKKLRVRSRLEREEAHVFYKDKGFTLSKQQNVFDKDLS